MFKINDKVTADEVLRLLNYNPDTGIFTWRTKSSRKSVVGKEAGTLVNGYRAIRIDGQRYFAHRLAWLIMTGGWPTDLIDHADGDKSNNRFSNLRAATKSLNAANSESGKRSASGFRGVHLQKRTGRYAARVTKGGKAHIAGNFDCPIEAYAAASKLRAHLFGEFDVSKRTQKKPA